MKEPTFQVAEWVSHDVSARTPKWKRGIYRVIRPLLNIEGRRHLSAQALARWSPDFVFTQRGLPLEHRRTLALKGIDVRDATILVQGTGSGWDVISWAERKPKRILATDEVAFASWEPIARHCRDRFGVTVEFRDAPMANCDFIPSGSIDLAASDAVFEHVRDLPGALNETARLLKPNGSLYASVGPIWFTAGGDHFSSRGGLENSFAHVDRSPDEYKTFFDHWRQPVEDFQSGGRYVEIDLFSKLTMTEYLECFTRAGFRSDWLGIQISQLALDFADRYPERAQAIVARHSPRITASDLVVAGFIVRLGRGQLR